MFIMSFIIGNTITMCCEKEDQTKETEDNIN